MILHSQGVRKYMTVYRNHKPTVWKLMCFSRQAKGEGACSVWSFREKANLLIETMIQIKISCERDAKSSS
jgi:hypothetical protein